ncbi:hypothetical protein SAMN06295879_1173 [Agreia bicolorata]|uniref:Uncharacterized protein n=1 Tax=Agreia bicolorata TaxID=110935 RepID=A0A1T4XI92_9MICO|nr:hypothetical protein [Agreia bicolorata]SKA89302.1 hypothetical protein SAMN06295879_1173 [Agreia bicolorata]
MNIVADATAFATVADVVRGRTPVSPQDRELMDWIAKRYGVSVVAVLADRGRLPREPNRLRVAVWLETDAEAARFDSKGGNYDSKKQRVIGTRVLADLSEDEPMPFVVPQSFAGEARSDIYLHFTPQDIERIKAELAHPLIRAVRIWTGAVVFLETDAQVAQFAESAERERWTDVIWRAIHKKDEFGAVPREAFSIRVDSEQTFQEKFEGNRYYYFL